MFWNTVYSSCCCKKIWSATKFKAAFLQGVRSSGKNECKTRTKLILILPSLLCFHVSPHFCVWALLYCFLKQRFLIAEKTDLRLSVGSLSPMNFFICTLCPLEIEPWKSQTLIFFFFFLASVMHVASYYRNKGHTFPFICILESKHHCSLRGASSAVVSCQFSSSRFIFIC